MKHLWEYIDLSCFVKAKDTFCWMMMLCNIPLHTYSETPPQAFLWFIGFDDCFHATTKQDSRGPWEKLNHRVREDIAVEAAPPTWDILD